MEAPGQLPSLPPPLKSGPANPNNHNPTNLNLNHNQMSAMAGAGVRGSKCSGHDVYVRVGIRGPEAGK